MFAPPPFRGPLLHSLEDVLIHMSQSEVFEEGISYALFKLSELGEVTSSEILLRYGANLHFEGNVRMYNFWLYIDCTAGENVCCPPLYIYGIYAWRLSSCCHLQDFW